MLSGRHIWIRLEVTVAECVEQNVIFWFRVELKAFSFYNIYSQPNVEMEAKRFCINLSFCLTVINPT